MNQAIGAVLPFAVGIGISPIPIVASILILFSERARVNGPMFLLGWATVLAIISAVVVTVASSAGVGDGGSTDDAVAWGKVGLGVLLVVGAARKWRSRPGPGEEPEAPAWMASIDTLTPVRALGLGALLGGVNPKNLALAVGAGGALAALSPTTTEAVVAIAVFVVIASAAIGAGVAYDLFGGDKAVATLEEAKGWLMANNAAVMAILFLVFGAVLISHGLQGG